MEVRVSSAAATTTIKSPLIGSSPRFRSALLNVHQRKYGRFNQTSFQKRAFVATERITDVSYIQQIRNTLHSSNLRPSDPKHLVPALILLFIPVISYTQMLESTSRITSSMNNARPSAPAATKATIATLIESKLKELTVAACQMLAVRLTA